MPEPLGVGFGWMVDAPAALYSLDLIDFVELAPEQFHRETGQGGNVTLLEDDAARELAQRHCGAFPTVIHGLALSIGSMHGLNEACLDMVERFVEDWPCLWYSEHLHFQTRIVSGQRVEIGVPLPLPPTREAVDLIAGRVSLLQRRLNLPFLLENMAHYVPDLPSDSDVGDEFGLMNQVTARADCGQLLDLHNLYCNALNFGFDPASALDRIDLERVGEIHIAGGTWHDGYYTDAHSGGVPGPVWDLLEMTLTRAVQVAGVVFEILPDHFGRFGPDAVARELEKARRIWRCHRPFGQSPQKCEVESPDAARRNQSSYHGRPR
jgi:uncharacterized protein (UPF0276 family)